MNQSRSSRFVRTKYSCNQYITTTFSARLAAARVQKTWQWSNSAVTEALNGRERDIFTGRSPAVVSNWILFGKIESAIPSWQCIWFSHNIQANLGWKYHQADLLTHLKGYLSETRTFLALPSINLLCFRQVFCVHGKALVIYQYPFVSTRLRPDRCA